MTMSQGRAGGGGGVRLSSGRRAGRAGFSVAARRLSPCGACA